MPVIAEVLNYAGFATVVAFEKTHYSNIFEREAALVNMCLKLILQYPSFPTRILRFLLAFSTATSQLTCRFYDASQDEIRNVRDVMHDAFKV